VTPRYLNTQSAADYLGISERKVRYLIEEGKLRSYNFDGCRRLKVDDLDEYAEARADRQEAVA
jgi:excisionase family DNA binding protein